MKQMLKYRLPEPGSMIAQPFPRNSIVRHVAMQGGVPQLWAEVLTSETDGYSEFHCFGTGWDIPFELEYIGTITTDNGFVWHYYRKAL